MVVELCIFICIRLILKLKGAKKNENEKYSKNQTEEKRKKEVEMKKRMEQEMEKKVVENQGLK